MKMKFVLVGLSMLSAFVASGLPVTAQARPALVKNIDEPGRSPYQVTVPCVDFSGLSFCEPQTPPIPTGKRLVLQYISARVASSFGPTNPPQFQLYNGDMSNILAEFPPVMTAAQVLLNVSVLYYYEAGQTVKMFIPNVKAYRVNGGSVTFTGYLVDLLS